MTLADIEYFISSEGTQYIWEREKEVFVRLTDEEVNLLKFKIRLMSDNDILNRESGNGTPMGIPFELNNKRLIEIKDIIIRIINNDGRVKIDDHAVNRITEDSYLDENNPNKRGWKNDDEVIKTVSSIKKVYGTRLNVNHFHPNNTEKIKHLQRHIAFVAEGKKNNDKVGRLVLIILNEDTLSVITVL